MWKHALGVSDMAREKKARLETTLFLKKDNGVTITVSTVCGNWESMQKFLSDFENTLLKGNDGKPQHSSKT